MIEIIEGVFVETEVFEQMELEADLEKDSRWGWYEDWSY